MPISLVFQGKFTEKYFKMFHLPEIHFKLLNDQFMDLLPNLEVYPKVTLAIQWHLKIALSWDTSGGKVDRRG